MNRLHMINWMYYGIQSLDFESSNLLSGPTGSGKSSIIDALQIIMLGEIGSRFFNRSATGSKSKRTIITYLRGKLHDDEFKRMDKAFSSYLVADFYDEKNRESFCYGIMFDIAEDDTVDKDFFFVAGDFLSEWALKTVKGKPVARSRREFKDEMKQRGVQVKTFSTGEYKNDILVRLGIYDKHFFQIFHTAVTYVPLDRIEDFIVRNICHMEDNVDVQKMKASIQEYKQMQRDMEDFSQRRLELEEIKRIHDDYIARLEIYATQEYLARRARVDALRDERLAAENQMLILENERERCNREADALDVQWQAKEDRQLELARLISSNPERQRKAELEKSIEVCSKKIKEREERRDKQSLLLSQRLSAWSQRLREAIVGPAKDELDCVKLSELVQTLELYKQHTKETFPDLDMLPLYGANRELDAVSKEVFTQYAERKNLRIEREHKAEEHKSALEKLKEGIKSYPQDLQTLRRHIQDTLSDRHNAPVDVEIFADLITISDPAWVNVIEGYLRRQKLFLFVEPQYYREAVRVFKQYSRENHCYCYRIVNTESIVTEQMIVLDNSLAKLIDTEYAAARKYADYLLGRVERVDNIEEIGGRRTAVTADGMLYSRFTVARINEADWQLRYIGQDSIAQQIEEITRLLREETALIDDLSIIIAHLQSLTEEKTLSDEFLEALGNAVTEARELPKLEAECDSLWGKLQQIDDSYAKKLEEEQKRVKEELGRLLKERDSINQRIGDLDRQHNEQYVLSGEKEEAWEKENKDFNVTYPEGDKTAEHASKRYESEVQQKGSAAKVKFVFETELLKTKTRIDGLTQTFQQKIEIFNIKHSESSISTEASSDEWRRAYDDVMLVQLEKFDEKVEKARKRAEEIFQNDFINQIYGNMETCKREIRMLNEALKEYRFGHNQYRFKCVPTENAENRRYYDMITNARLDGASIFDLIEHGTDFSEYEPLVKTLFQLISSEGDSPASRREVEANIEKYKSFQTYLHFDLVEVGKDGKEYPLSRIMGSQSGGERQTPFYIAILASLMKTYKVSQDANSLRLVVFDEAFDKIDTSRIEECIEMLRNIGFQSIIAAPDSKAAYIAPLVEKTFAVIKPDDKTSVIYPYHKDQEVAK